MAEADGDVLKPRRARRSKAAEVPDTPDPIEIAMKAMATGADRHGSAQAVLEKHACLIDIQCAREKEELGILRLKRFSRWLLLGAGIALLGALTLIVYNASRSTSLVIEPFEVPPALAQRGLNGKVVSARVLDRLAELQRNTESTRAESSYANNWEDDIQVDIPQTGMSAGQVWRALRSMLGNETRIGGEVIQTAEGLTVTTRAGSLSGGTVAGTEAGFDQLVQKAAEQIYKATQPYRYAISLPSYSPETEQVLLGLVDHDDPLERRWAYSGLSAHYRRMGEDQRALTMARAALEIEPDMIPALGNVGLASMNLGHDEAAVAAFEKSGRIAAGAIPGEFDPRIVRANRNGSEAYLGRLTGDPIRMLEGARGNIAGRSRTFKLSGYHQAIEASIMSHDYVAARGFAARVNPTPAEAQEMRWPLSLTRYELLRALDLGDRAGAQRRILHLIRSADALAAAEGPAAVADRTARERFLWPLAARTFAELGDGTAARGFASRTPLDCYRCVVSRGQAAAALGDRAAADRWFREAVRQAPSLGYAHLEWGKVLMERGDAPGAMQRLAAANERSPRYADPLKLWGDLLMRQGKIEEATGKYAAAAKFAPQWGALQIAWAEALLRGGKRQEAQPRLRAAAATDLSQADRARIARLWAAAGGRA